MGCPWSRAWQCFGRPALAMIAIGRHRERLSSFNDRGAWLHGLPVVPCLAVLWPAGSGDDRHRAPPATADEFHRSRRLASWGCPWSRGWRCLGRPAAGIASDGQRKPAPLPAGSDRDAEFARAAQPALAMIAIGRHRERLSSFNDRGAWLHGLPVVPCLAVLWPAGCRDRERVPAEPGAATGRERSRRRVCPI